MDPKKPRDRPFYQLPEKVQASSRIINEARTSLRAVGTKRPFTPRDENRTLFPASTARAPEARPPSAFSLNSRHFEGSDSRPVSGTRLSPLDHIPPSVTPADIESAIKAPKPPADPNRPVSRKGSRSKLTTASSNDGGDTPVIRPRSGSSEGRHVSEVITSDPDKPRRVHSGPKERTPPLPSEERGMADGKETPPRVSSSMGSSTSPKSPDSREPRVGGSQRSGRTVTESSRGGSAGKKESIDLSDDNFYTEKVVPIIEEMNTVGKGVDTERLGQLAEELYDLLDSSKKFSKSYRPRSAILKAIFRLLDVEEARVLLRLARLILAFKVGGNNLLNVCKLVFKVSRNEKNDTEFLEANMLDLLLDTVKHSDHVASCEALIYCVGAIKFLTGNPTLLKRLAKKECIEILAALMQKIEKTNRENGQSNEQYGHILVQLCAALRNLADVGSGRERFIRCHVIESLTYLLETYPGDCDLVLYVSRIFSKLTLHTDCCNLLTAQLTCYRTFLHLLNRHLNKEDVVVRVCFVLGNLTARNDEARQRLFQESKSLSTLLAVLRTFHSMDAKRKPEVLESRRNKDGEDGAINKVDDVLIKVVRVIANLSINETVGPTIASSAECLQMLLGILDTRDMGTSEELILNTVATINNLSYYTTKTSAIVNNQSTVAKALMKLMLTDNMEAMLESSRVLGNLTRQKAVRDLLTENKVVEVMITLLDSGSRELVFIACGVLINFMADDDKRPLLKREKGIEKLVEVLRDFGREDWQLSSTVCKVLCNYSTKITSSNDCFGDTEAQELADILHEYLDRESALEMSLQSEEDEEAKDFLLETWECDFCPVAKQLLKRIEAYQSKFEPLEAPG